MNFFLAVFYHDVFSFITTGITDWDSTEEQDILARVLAESQQEYLDSLKKKNVQSNNNNNNNNRNKSRSASPEPCKSSKNPH